MHSPALRLNSALPSLWVGQERTAVVFCFVLALSVGIALTGLSGWHLYLILTAQTTIEFYINRYERAVLTCHEQSFSAP